MEDTIAAISTTLGIGAISIIRVSGNNAIEYVNKVFDGKDLKEVDSHTIHYGFIVEKGKQIDEVLVSIMKAPKTFTKEDVIEINCHGGIATTNKVLEILLNTGCRLASPGEFTKRAFLNGRIDLTEAEGIMDLINAKTDKARALAINQVSGKVSSLIRELRQDIIKILANIEVNIDYPEYEDIEEVTHELLFIKIKKIEKKIKEILSESENSKIIKEGIKTVIIGKPNVGKSSLLNALIEENKAIVTDIEGTTRDIVEGTVNINGVLFNLIDTAGIRKADNLIEQIGVQKSLELLNDSDLILFVLNNNERVTEDEIKILKQIENKNHIIIINKIDLETELDLSLFDMKKIVKISINNNKGILELKDKIKEMYNLEQLDKSDFTYISNARSISLLKQAVERINSIYEGINNQYSIDMIEIDIKELWNLLGEIIGETYQEDLINQLFSQFCLGK